MPLLVGLGRLVREARSDSTVVGRGAAFSE
jgi:hypothetical protein